MDIVYQYTKIRENFGRQPMFCEYGPELCDNIPVNVAEHKHFILRNPVHTAMQHGPRFSQCEINTIRAEYTSTSINHPEGGWPKDVNINDPESTQRYRRKIEKDDGYINCVMSAAAPAERLILQNNAIEMYQAYFTELPQQREVVTISCRTVNVYRDQSTLDGGTKRRVTGIAWRPDGGRKFCVCYNAVDFDRRPIAPINCHIWDIENANSAEITFTPPSVLLGIEYNPRDIPTLAGGLMNGQVAVWDQRDTMREPAVMCPPHVAHRDMVSGVRFINAKTGKEFFSGSPDGTCKWWDIRNMSEPIDFMMIDVVPNNNVKQAMPNTDGVCCIEFEPTIPTRFMAGTENGFVVCGNRKGKTATDMLPAKFDCHLGPVWTVERNPAFLKNFLTVGDWTVRVWSEECRESPVLWSPPLRHKIWHAAWSPTRISLIFLAHHSGTLAVWDILRRQHEPVLTTQICKEPLTRVGPHEAGSLVALGNSIGNIFMVEMSQSLSESDKPDKGLMTLMLEREAKRERILEARMREIRVKMKALEEMGEPKASLTSMPEAVGDKDLIEAQAEYFQTCKKELTYM